MRFLVCPNAFKESLAAEEAAAAIRRGVRRVFRQAQFDLCPLADGGDGTAEVLTKALEGKLVRSFVTGPLGGPVRARWGWIAGTKTAVIDMAAASGLVLVPPELRNPLKTTTFGTGELIRRALDKGARRILIGVGGSATVDGGEGAARALGPDPRIFRAETFVLCDVETPLLGRRGAARVFGPQKGATPAQVKILEARLRDWARALARAGCRADPRAQGMGAAGGLAFGLAAVAGARLTPGIDFVLNAVGFEKRLKQADYVLTGEGRVDATSLDGKALGGVLRASRKWRKPVAIFCGRAVAGIGKILRRNEQIHQISDPKETLARSFKQAEARLEAAAAAWAGLMSR